MVTAYTDGRVTLRSNVRLDGYHEAADMSAMQGVAAGDFVVHGLDILRGSVGVSDSAGAISSVCTVCEPVASADPRYFAWVIRAQAKTGFPRALARGVREGGADFRRWDTLAELPVPAPPVGEQRSIADFLDRETARIDALIATKRRMIEVVHEQLAAWSVRHVLGEGVSGGKSPSSSGFYGGVPRGWRETALRHLGCDVQTGPFGSQLHAADYVEGGWPVVNPMNIVDGGMRAVESMTVTEDKRTELARHMLRRGDIVFGRRGEMGRAGLVAPEQEGWLCGTGSLRLRLNGPHLLPSYLLLLLGSPPARAFFELSSVGSTMDNLNSEIVLSFPALVPPLEVQQAIVDAIVGHRRVAGDLDVRLAKQIDLLVEHRQALIIAAVTGELDTHEAAA